MIKGKIIFSIFIYEVRFIYLWHFMLMKLIQYIIKNNKFYIKKKNIYLMLNY